MHNITYHNHAHTDQHLKQCVRFAFVHIHYVYYMQMFWITLPTNYTYEWITSIDMTIHVLWFSEQNPFIVMKFWHQVKPNNNSPPICINIQILMRKLINLAIRKQCVCHCSFAMVKNLHFNLKFTFAVISFGVR